MMTKLRHIISLTACVSLVVLAGCSRNGPPASVHYDQASSPFHIVRKGESLSLIAKRYRINKNKLVHMNGLQPPYRIVVGQRILIGAPAMAESEMTDNSESSAVEPASEGDVKVAPLQPLPGTPVSTAPVGVSTGPVAVTPTPPGMNEEPGAAVAPGMLTPSMMATAVPIPAPQESTLIDDDDMTDDGAQPAQEAEKKNPIPMAPPPPSAGSFLWPVKGKVVKDFSKASGKAQNDGLNISAPKGTPVIAVNNGVVAHAGNQLRGFGNVVLIKHDKGLMTVYAHLDEMLVKKGDVVNAGQKIGAVGKSGTVKEPQLHFEIRKGTTPVDPKKHLS